MHVLVDIGNAPFAVPADAYVELFSLPGLMPAPGAPAYVLGLANVRGTILPVVDVGARLGGPSGAVGEASAVLRLRFEAGDVGILVDAVRDFVDVESEPVPLLDDQPGTLGGRVASVVRTDSGPVPVLDLERHLRSDVPMLAGLRSATDGASAGLAAVFESRAAELAGDSALGSGGLEGFVILQVEAHRYAVPSSLVASIAALSFCEPLPGAPDHVIGVTRLRGRTVVVVDARAVLGHGLEARPLPSYVCVLARDGDAVAIAVDVIGAMEYLDVTAVMAPPAEVASDLATGIVFSADGPTTLLAPDRLFAILLAPEGAPHE
jgi:purine-binding chemotaxis protein CheW